MPLNWSFSVMMMLIVMVSMSMIYGNSVIAESSNIDKKSSLVMMDMWYW